MNSLLRKGKEILFIKYFLLKNYNFSFLNKIKFKKRRRKELYS
jgi:hypothetical protein